MNISREEINEVVRRVLAYYMQKKNMSDKKRSLYLIPSCPVGLEETLTEYDLYGITEDMDFVTAEEFLSPVLHEKTVFHKNDRIQMQHVFRNLTKYHRLEIHCPTLDFLRAVRDGREEDVFVRITLYFLMSYKTVVIRQPYGERELPGGRFSKMAEELRSDLWDMGVTFTNLKVSLGSVSGQLAETEGGLITEKIVSNSYKKGLRELFTARNTVITPLAQERANELGVRIVRK